MEHHTSAASAVMAQQHQGMTGLHIFTAAFHCLPKRSEERESEPLHTRRQPQSFPLRCVCSKSVSLQKKNIPTNSVSITEAWEEAKTHCKPCGCSLRNEHFGRGLHHSACSLAGLCSTFSFYGAGMGLQQRGMQGPCRRPWSATPQKDLISSSTTLAVTLVWFP